MRWTEQPAELPLRPLAALVSRLPGIDALLGELAPADGLVIAVDGSAADDVLRHLGWHDEERGGLLLGEVYAEGGTVHDSRVVHVTQAVAATDFASSGVALRMASAVWEEARNRLRPAELIVGWYHSHPGLGAFFSHTDRRTQRGFFPHAYSVGWVLDPLDGDSAWFVGPESMPPARVLPAPPARDTERGIHGAL